MAYCSVDLVEGRDWRLLFYQRPGPMSDFRVFDYIYRYAMSWKVVLLQFRSVYFEVVFVAGLMYCRFEMNSLFVDHQMGGWGSDTSC